MILHKNSSVVLRLINTCGRLSSFQQAQHIRQLPLLPLSGYSVSQRQEEQAAHVPGRHFQGKVWKQQISKMSSASSSSDGNNRSPTTPWQQEFYRYFLPIQTRIRDTDWFGHVNNPVYNAFADTVANHFLIRHCGLQHPRKDPQKPNIVGFMVDTRCAYKYPFNYPEVVLCGLAVTKVGNSSVTYTVGMFPESADGGVRNQSCRLPSLAGDLFKPEETACYDSHQKTACAVNQCVHVFVDLNGDQKPVRIPDSFTVPFQKIYVPYDSQVSRL